jgi:hypothetical protein
MIWNAYLGLRTRGAEGARTDGQSAANGHVPHAGLRS